MKPIYTETIIFDTETTDLVKNPAKPLAQQPYIIEVGAIKVDEHWNELGRINFLCKPPMKIPKFITNINGIDDAMLRDQPAFSGNFGELADFFRGSERMIAHNLPFDRNLLLFELRRIGMEFHFPWPAVHTCTAENAKSLFNGKYTKLQNIYKHAYGKDPKQTHRAVGDCELLLDVCKWLDEQGVM